MYKNFVCFGIVLIFLAACGESSSGGPPSTPAAASVGTAAAPASSAMPAATVPTTTVSASPAATDPTPSVRATPLTSSGLYIDPASEPAIWAASNSNDAGRLQILNDAVTQFKTLAPNTWVIWTSTTARD